MIIEDEDKKVLALRVLEEMDARIRERRYDHRHRITEGVRSTQVAAMVYLLISSGIIGEKEAKNYLSKTSFRGM